MDEYIEREKAIGMAISGRIRALPTTEDGEDWIRVEEVRESLQSIPAADVVARDCYDRLLAENDELRKERPVCHGRWIKSPECPEEYDICSVCGLNDKHRTRGNMEHPSVESIPPFCKWCGAIMDLEADNG